MKDCPHIAKYITQLQVQSRFLQTRHQPRQTPSQHGTAARYLGKAQSTGGWVNAASVNLPSQAATPLYVHAGDNLRATRGHTIADPTSSKQPFAALSKHTSARHNTVSRHGRQHRLTADSDDVAPLADTGTRGGGEAQSEYAVSSACSAASPCAASAAADVSLCGQSSIDISDMDLISPGSSPRSISMSSEVTASSACTSSTSMQQRQRQNGGTRAGARPLQTSSVHLHTNKPQFHLDLSKTTGNMELHTPRLHSARAGDAEDRKRQLEEFRRAKAEGRSTGAAATAFKKPADRPPNTMFKATAAARQQQQQQPQTMFKDTATTQHMPLSSRRPVKPVPQFHEKPSSPSTSAPKVLVVPRLALDKMQMSGMQPASADAHTSSSHPSGQQTTSRGRQQQQHQQQPPHTTAGSPQVQHAVNPAAYGSTQRQRVSTPTGAALGPSPGKQASHHKSVTSTSKIPKLDFTKLAGTPTQPHTARTVVSAATSALPDQGDHSWEAAQVPLPDATPRLLPTAREAMMRTPLQLPLTPRDATPSIKQQQQAPTAQQARQQQQLVPSLKLAAAAAISGAASTPSRLPPTPRNTVPPDMPQQQQPPAATPRAIRPSAQQQHTYQTTASTACMLTAAPEPAPTLAAQTARQKVSAVVGPAPLRTPRMAGAAQLSGLLSENKLAEQERVQETRDQLRLLRMQLLQWRYINAKLCAATNTRKAKVTWSPTTFCSFAGACACKPDRTCGVGCSKHTALHLLASACLSWLSCMSNTTHSFCSAG